MGTKLLAAAVLAALLACGETGAPQSGATPAHPDPVTRPDPAAVPDPAPRDLHPHPAPPASGRVRDALGADNVAIVEGAERIEIGRMRVTAVLQAEQRWLAHLNEITGHPLTTDLRALDPANAETAALVAMLLDESSYDFETERRCRNDFYVGMRFTRGEDVVELALGMPCTQAFFVYRDGSDIQSFGGGLLNDPHARNLVDLSAP